MSNCNAEYNEENQAVQLSIVILVDEENNNGGQPQIKVNCPQMPTTGIPCSRPSTPCYPPLEELPCSCCSRPSTPCSGGKIVIPISVGKPICQEAVQECAPQLINPPQIMPTGTTCCCSSFMQNLPTYQAPPSAGVPCAQVPPLPTQVKSSVSSQAATTSYTVPTQIGGSQAAIQAPSFQRTGTSVVMGTQASTTSSCQTIPQVSVSYQTGTTSRPDTAGSTRKPCLKKSCSKKFLTSKSEVMRSEMSQTTFESPLPLPPPERSAHVFAPSKPPTQIFAPSKPSKQVFAPPEPSTQIPEPSAQVSAPAEAPMPVGPGDQPEVVTIQEEEEEPPRPKRKSRETKESEEKKHRKRFSERKERKRSSEREERKRSSEKEERKRSSEKDKGVKEKRKRSSEKESKRKSSGKKRRSQVPPEELNFSMAPNVEQSYVDLFLKTEAGVSTVIKLAQGKRKYEKKCKEVIATLSEASKNSAEKFFMKIVEAIQVKFPETNTTEVKHFELPKYVIPILTEMKLDAVDEFREINKYHKYIVSVCSHMEGLVRARKPISPEAIVEIETLLLAEIVSRFYPVFLKLKELFSQISKTKTGSPPAEYVKQLRKLILTIYVEIACIDITFTNALTTMNQSVEAQEKFRKMLMQRKAHARHSVTWAARCVATSMLYYYLQRGGEG